MVVTSTEGKLMTMLNSMFHSGRIKRAAPARERDVGAGPAHVEDDHVGLRSAVRPMAAPAITPAAGPDWQMRAGMRRAASIDITPPPEWVMRTGPA